MSDIEIMQKEIEELVRKADQTQLAECDDMTALEIAAVCDSTTDIAKRMYLCYKFGFLKAQEQRQNKCTY